MLREMENATKILDMLEIRMADAIDSICNQDLAPDEFYWPALLADKMAAAAQWKFSRPQLKLRSSTKMPDFECSTQGLEERR